MDRKYTFTGETKEFGKKMVSQIQYIRSFGEVNAGDLGGWIESEHNLSHESNCYIGENSYVIGNARVEDNAIVKHLSIVKDNARIQENARIEKSIVGADTIVMYDSWVLNSHVEMFQTISEEEHGILGSSKIVSCSIVATGAIFSSKMENKTLTGRLHPFM